MRATARVLRAVLLLATAVGKVAGEPTRKADRQGEHTKQRGALPPWAARHASLITEWDLAIDCSPSNSRGQNDRHKLTPASHLLTRIGAAYSDATDKIPMTTRRKAKKHSYSEFYGPLFDPIRNSVRNMMEIGVREGGSLQMWQKFFPAATVWGMDMTLHHVTPEAARQGLKIAAGDGYNASDISAFVGDTKFDVVIDDGSHQAWDQARFFNVWKEHVAPGGYLFSEDVLSTANAQYIVQAFEGEQRRMSIVDRTLTTPSYCDERIVMYMACGNNSASHRAASGDRRR
jgi:hypothetical protein